MNRLTSSNSRNITRRCGMQVPQRCTQSESAKKTLVRPTSPISTGAEDRTSTDSSNQTYSRWLRLRRHVVANRCQPQRSAPLPEAVSILRHLASLPDTTVAIISGRALRDLAAMSRLPIEIDLVGSHGAEFDLGFNHRARRRQR